MIICCIEARRYGLVRSNGTYKVGTVQVRGMSLCIDDLLVCRCTPNGHLYRV
jgi:hypothetical protein